MWPRCGCLSFLLALACLSGPLLAPPDASGDEPRRTVETAAGVLSTEVTGSAGLRFRHVNGATPVKYMPETMGAGALFFDFDRDGALDIFLVDSGSLVDRDVARQVRSVLYRNQGNGTFRDVTERSGL